LRNDFYLNLFDWSSRNFLAVALHNNVYLWDATQGDIIFLMTLESEDDYVCSLSWTKDGSYLAVGTSDCKVQLWDVENQKRLRSMASHTARVGSLSWNDHILSSGSRSGHIHHHDVRVAEHHICTLAGHSQEVCGLQWSPDGRYLASGGNDNLLCVWPRVPEGSPGNRSQAIHKWSEHQGAIKALAWCPWQPNILASGGGTSDRHIRIWNVNSGSCVSSLDTQSQVSSLVFAPNYKELVSAHGYAHNNVVIWKYPSLTKVVELHDLNLLDWSSRNFLAVALQNNVYLWDATKRNIIFLMTLEREDDYVCSLSWTKDGSYLAVGTSDCKVQLWDVENQKRLRSMASHTARVGSLSWNDHILSSGSRSGHIHHHDVRVAEHHICTLAGHSQEVCGLQWSPDGRYLASGGNDNLLCVWPRVPEGSPGNRSQAIHKWSEHQGAIKVRCSRPETLRPLRISNYSSSVLMSMIYTQCFWSHTVYVNPETLFNVAAGLGLVSMAAQHPRIWRWYQRPSHPHLERQQRLLRQLTGHPVTGLVASVCTQLQGAGLCPRIRSQQRCHLEVPLPH
ncbi:unnamed protein product, partial [Tetraodon nigroviridis]